MNTSRIVLAVLAIALPGAASAENLLDIYQRALQSDPLIREAEANRMATSEAAPQARGLLFPQITASGGASEAGSEGSRVITNVIGGVVIQEEVPFEDRNVEGRNWEVQLTQTVFRWDQIAGLQQAGKRVAQADAQYEAAQQDLLLRVSERYFDVLAAEDSLEASEANRIAIAKQLDQSQKRFEVGLIAITDVQESQAAFDQSVADEIAAKRTLATATYLLTEITGSRITELAKPAGQIPLVAPQPANENTWVDTALGQNLTLVASRIESEIASKEIGVRRGSRYPTLDLVVRRSYNQQDSEQSFNGSAFSPFAFESDNESIALQFSVPVFSGFRTTSQIREAVYLHRAARERVQRVSRETERLTRDAYLGVLTEISRTKALEQALRSSETALEATQAGFEVGTRTTVDVLDAQRNLFNARTQFLRARYDYLLNVLRLKNAAGSLRVQDLETINALLEE
ncbi:MAG: TolC family outer membrane protein [Pseudomonadota bacterium]